MKTFDMRFVVAGLLFVFSSTIAAVPKPTFGPPPPLQSAGKAVSPTSAEVEAHILKLQKDHPSLVKVTIPGKTSEGRPIYAVTLTDPQAVPADKQHVLVVAGQHGNEESSRMIALALMDWLVSPDGAPTLRKQKIVVMPNVNPDGAERDIYDTAEGIRPNLDHAPDGPWSAEAKALQSISRELRPEVYVDMHGRGGAGCSYDMVLHPMTFPYMEDGNLLQQIAAEMVKAGEAAGIPHLTHSLTWPGWGNSDIKDSSSTVFHYREFHSMVFLTETSEHNDHAHPADLRIAVGLARLKTLLDHGNRRHPWFHYEGYPYGLIGMNDAALAAIGKTAADRRASRVALWAGRGNFTTPRAVLPAPAAEKRYTFTAKKDFASRMGIQLRCATKMRVESVRLNDQNLSVSETDGYLTWQDNCSTFILITRPAVKAGEYAIYIGFR